MCILEDWDIELQGVFLFCEGSQVLKEIFERIVFGKNFGIVGFLGVGKIMLVLIILGIIRFIKGKVKIGKCLFEFFFGREFIYVLLQLYFFEGMVRENIVFGKNFIDSEIVEILKIVEFEELNFDLFIEEGGKNLLLGQRQRIVLVRVLVRNFRIMILDEVILGMDFEREVRIF